MPALLAFLHHLAAFALVAALVVEFVLINDSLGVNTARKLLRADLVFGAAAGTVLIVGFVRIFFFEKGAAYYFYSTPFIFKLSVFATVGLLSIYPTVEFLAWRKSLRAGQLPSASDRKLKRIRAVIHAELVGVVLVILGAALMARGVGS